MLLPITRCDQTGLDPMLRACRVLRSLIRYAARSNAFFACRQRVWRPAAQSRPHSPRPISKNTRSYWIWKATSKIVAYATKWAAPSAGIAPRRPAAAQIVVDATIFVARDWLHPPTFPRPIHFDAFALSPRGTENLAPCPRSAVLWKCSSALTNRDDTDFVTSTMQARYMFLAPVGERYFLVILTRKDAKLGMLPQQIKGSALGAR
jgi:hypothetical protein